MPRLSQDNTLPSSITNIRLSSALSDCGPVGVANAFDKSSHDQLFVYDDNGLGYTDWDDTEPAFRTKCFIALNPNGTIIALLPLDGRIITGRSVTTGGVCDALLLSDKEICFIEFKTNVTSPNYQTIIQRANEAVGQLWHTYDCIIRPRCALKSRDIDRLLSIYFYVVFDEGLEVTGANSELMDLQMQFIEDKRLPLFFANRKKFS